MNVSNVMARRKCQKRLDELLENYPDINVEFDQNHKGEIIEKLEQLTDDVSYEILENQTENLVFVVTDKFKNYSRVEINSKTGDLYICESQ